MKIRKGAVSWRTLALLSLSLILLYFTFCPPVKAEEIKGQFFIPVSARYIDNLGVGAGLGWQDRKTGFIVMAQLTYDRIDGDTARVDIPSLDTSKHCHHNPPQWRTLTVVSPDRNVTGVTLTMGIPITGRKGKK